MTLGKDLVGSLTIKDTFTRSSLTVVFDGWCGTPGAVELHGSYNYELQNFHMTHSSRCQLAGLLVQDSMDEQECCRSR